MDPQIQGSRKCNFYVLISDGCDKLNLNPILEHSLELKVMDMVNSGGKEG